MLPPNICWEYPRTSRSVNVSWRHWPQARRNSRKAFNTTLDSVNINRLTDGLYVSINPGFTRITGYTEEDVIGKTSTEFNIWVHSDDRQRLVDGLLKDGEVANLEATFRMKNGELRYVDVGVNHRSKRSSSYSQHNQGHYRAAGGWKRNCVPARSVSALSENAGCHLHHESGWRHHLCEPFLDTVAGI